MCESLLSIQIKVKVQRMSKYSVSVGIVFYNPSQETLQHNIDEAIHIMEKSQNDISFYFLDNGSSQSENFGQVVYPDGVQFIQIAENVGFGGGHNQLLPTIESDVHIVMNPDIHLKDVGNLDEAIDYLMTHETSLLSPKLQSADGQIRRGAYRRVRCFLPRETASVPLSSTAPRAVEPRRNVNNRRCF